MCFQVNGDTMFVDSNFKRPLDLQNAMANTADYNLKMDDADTSFSSDKQLAMEQYPSKFNVSPPLSTTSRSGLVVGPQVEFTVEKIQRIMGEQDNICNMSVIAHVDHDTQTPLCLYNLFFTILPCYIKIQLFVVGKKPTLTDSLVAVAGIIAPEDIAGDVEMANTLPDEAKRGITTKLSGRYLYYKMNDAAHKTVGECNLDFLINLIDTPGHTDFSSEVTAALCISDGVCVQTEALLRQALAERIRPVLTINKMDNIFELVDDDEEAYLMLDRIINDINTVIATYKDPLLGDVMVSPDKGRRVKDKGTNYDPEPKVKWSKEHTGGASCQRAFVKYCYAPVKKVIKTFLNDDKGFLWPMLEKYKMTMKSEEKDLTGNELIRYVMQKWHPAATSLLEMSVLHLPSPLTTQRYRVENLYPGDDLYTQGIRTCDPNAPLMLYVSKMIPTHDKGAFFAFGRVFLGRVRIDLRVRIMGPNVVPGEHIETVKGTAIWMGNKQVMMETVSCGNTVALFGLDGLITKNSTLTTEEEIDAHPIRAMKFSVSPFVSVAVWFLIFKSSVRVWNI
ncbi:Elongation factor G, III-V domain-containing protein [Artemisia annua]|uniref:Elongation factor G, III-V domain-containing protein n=1 Tax=Artemisia annua TaxID=35608 RepID=A0A2U1NV05_ARTAN|nr:Elongation factor G, III-V domain-containing protein [Artemisia annua]